MRNIAEAFARRMLVTSEYTSDEIEIMTEAFADHLDKMDKAEGGFLNNARPQAERFEMSIEELIDISLTAHWGSFCAGVNAILKSTKPVEH